MESFLSLYYEVSTNNVYIKAFELTPKMTYSEKVSGYNSILLDLLSCDTNLKLFHNIITLATILIYLFTGNLLVFTNMVWALIQLIKKGKISRAVGKMLIILLRKKGISIPEELEDLT